MYGSMRSFIGFRTAIITQTIIVSITPAVNVFATLMLLLYIYGVAGMQVTYLRTAT
jgi:hypothetical protein